MANYRQFQTTFWQDDFIQNLSHEERYFYIYLITNPHVNICGIYSVSERSMEFETGLEVDKIRKLIKTFEDAKKIKYSKDTNELCIVNFIRHNLNRSEKTHIAFRSALEKVKNKSLIGFLAGIEFFIERDKKIDTNALGYAYPIDRASIGYGYLSGISETISETESISGTKTEQNKTQSYLTQTPSDIQKTQQKENSAKNNTRYEEDEVDKEFRAILEVYPIERSSIKQAAAREKYRELRKNNAIPEIENIIFSIKNQKWSVQWQNSQYVPLLLTWLEKEHWKNELELLSESEIYETKKGIGNARYFELKDEWATKRGYTQSSLMLQEVVDEFRKYLKERSARRVAKGYTACEFECADCQFFDNCQ